VAECCANVNERSGSVTCTRLLDSGKSESIPMTSVDDQQVRGCALNAQEADCPSVGRYTLY
jgi:hypothetical protein